MARRLCLEYDTICIENLNIKGMHRLWGRKISGLPIVFEAVGHVDDYLMKYYYATIQQKNLNDNARFIDYISRDALKEIMRSWNFYVQGSICEGQPNSILEYFQNGKAFISSNTGFWAELLRKDYYELFFES